MIQWVKFYAHNVKTDLLFIPLAKKSCKFLGIVMNALTKWMLQKWKSWLKNLKMISSKCIFYQIS